MNVAVLTRRHLTPSQRAVIAAKAEPMFAAEAGMAKLPYPEKAGTARRQAADEFGVSERARGLVHFPDRA